ncbi:ArsR family transcriptional regulator [Halorubrum sp. ASP1]|uniref:winged helix-turn-helix domain-containing protein n=1 Tax=Halorubrum sp. ASP1 TaxID=2518114 RepID=UPI0010F4F25B|nr:helix-turn-helix domain-containing protein [Halorubrum sp. ASP1]TKX60751.1 ArsR family transcriptional regulator [Halorubrum sp. ASP1]
MAGIEGDEFLIHVDDAISEVSGQNSNHPPITTVGEMFSTPVRRDLCDYFVSEGLFGDSSPRSLSTIADDVGVDIQSVSDNIGIFEEIGMLSYTREGPRHLYSLVTDNQTFTTVTACAGGFRELLSNVDGPRLDVDKAIESLPDLFRSSVRRRLCEICFTSHIAGGVQIDPLSLTEWADIAGASRYAVSQHLPVLDSVKIMMRHSEEHQDKYTANTGSLALELLAGVEIAAKGSST